MIARRTLLAIGAVVDIGLHARGRPVSSKALAARLKLSARHLEPILQDLVKANILKGMRGPHGGYELARERRRINAGEIVRLVERLDRGNGPEMGHVALIDTVVTPMLAQADEAFLAMLDRLTIDEFCRKAEQRQGIGAAAEAGQFQI